MRIRITEPMRREICDERKYAAIATAISRAVVHV